jgi:2-dehydro-3-deoxyphosphogluconate aldolase/(4S)-4-hydroxy-2-oxoglutarate aldolase
VIAIARGLDPARLPAFVDAHCEGGIDVLELTLNSAAALDSITALRHRAEGSRLLIGAGTVLSPLAAAAAVTAGASFLVTPVVDVPTITWAGANGIPIFPGAMTPTEILTAWAAGATAVKLFPASVVGPTFVREVRGPLPEIPLIPTGGVSAGSAPAFLEAGAVAVAVGSWLTGVDDPTVVLARARELRSAIDRP